MAVFYCLFAVIVILMNYASFSAAIGNISNGAFTGGLFMFSGELGRAVTQAFISTHPARFSIAISSITLIPALLSFRQGM